MQEIKSLKREVHQLKDTVAELEAGQAAAVIINEKYQTTLKLLEQLLIEKVSQSISAGRLVMGPYKFRYGNNTIFTKYRNIDTIDRRWGPKRVRI